MKKRSVESGAGRPAPLSQMMSVSVDALPVSLHSAARRAGAGDDLCAKNATQNIQGVLNKNDDTDGADVVEELGVTDGLNVPGVNGVMDADGGTGENDVDTVADANVHNTLAS